MDIAAREAAWEQLRGRLELHEGFWLGFLFGLPRRVVGELTERSTQYLRATARGVEVRELAQPDNLPGTIHWLFGLDAAPGLVWVTDRTGRGDDEWRQGWRSLLLRLNERRERLRQSLPTGLVLTGARWLLPLVRDIAPDLWSYRSTVYLAPEGVDQPRYPTVKPTRVVPAEGELRRFAEIALAPPVEPSPEVRERIQLAERELQAGRHDRVVTHALAAFDAAFSPADNALAAAYLAFGRHGQGDPAAAGEAASQALGSGVALGADVTDDLLAVLVDSPDPDDHMFAAQRRVAMAGLASERGTGRVEALAMALAQLGQAHYDHGNLAAAQESFAEAVTLNRRLYAENGTPERLGQLATALRRLGDSLVEGGNLAHAEAVHVEGLDLERRLLASQGANAGMLARLSDALNELGDVYEDQGRPDAAQEAFRESIERARALRDLAGDTEPVLQTLSYALNRLGVLDRQLGDLPGAEELLAEDLTLSRRRRELAGDQPRILHDLAVTLADLGAVRAMRGDAVGAEDLYTEAVGLERRLNAAGYGTADNLTSLSGALIRLADIRLDAGDLSQARALCAESLELHRRLRELLGDTPETLRNHSRALDNLANTEELRGDLDGAVELYSQATQLDRERLARFGESPDTLNDLSIGLSRLGDVLGARGKDVQARAAYREAVHWYERLAAEHGAAAAADPEVLARLRGKAAD